MLICIRPSCLFSLARSILWSVARFLLLRFPYAMVMTTLMDMTQKIVFGFFFHGFHERSRENTQIFPVAVCESRITSIRCHLSIKPQMGQTQFAFCLRFPRKKELITSHQFPLISDNILQNNDFYCTYCKVWGSKDISWLPPPWRTRNQCTCIPEGAE